MRRQASSKEEQQWHVRQVKRIGEAGQQAGKPGIGLRTGVSLHAHDDEQNRNERNGHQKEVQISKLMQKLEPADGERGSEKGQTDQAYDTEALARRSPSRN